MRRATRLGGTGGLTETLPGLRKPGPFLFPSFAHGQGYYPLRDCWRAVCEDGEAGAILAKAISLNDIRNNEH